MEKFAKFFELDDGGHIVVLNDCNDDGMPTVKIMFQPEGLGICSIGPVFNDTDDGYAQCDDVFNSIDRDQAIEAVENAMKMLTGNQ